MNQETQSESLQENGIQNPSNPVEWVQTTYTSLLKKTQCLYCRRKPYNGYSMCVKHLRKKRRDRKKEQKLKMKRKRSGIPPKPRNVLKDESERLNLTREEYEALSSYIIKIEKRRRFLRKKPEFIGKKVNSSYIKEYRRRLHEREKRQTDECNDKGTEKK